MIVSGVAEKVVTLIAWALNFSSLKASIAGITVEKIGRVTPSHDCIDRYFFKCRTSIIGADGAEHFLRVAVDRSQHTFRHDLSVGGPTGKPSVTPAGIHQLYRIIFYLNALGVQWNSVRHRTPPL